MDDYIELVGAIQQIAHNTTNAHVPCDIKIGEVIAVNPLKIRLESKVELDEDFIILTKNTCEWTVEMSVDHHTENQAGGSGEAAFASHNHGYLGRKKFLVHNQLVIGDKVILIRESGGQRFIALDRVFNPNRGCTS